MKHLILILFALLTFSVTAQEIIIESTGTISVPNDQFQNVVTKVQIRMDNTYVFWGDSPATTLFRTSVSVTTEDGVVLGSHTHEMSAAVLDIASGTVDFHEYVRDQIFTLVELVDPYGLTVWNKLY